MRTSTWDKAVASMKTEVLRNEQFEEAWHEWEAYAIERRLKLTDCTVRRQVRKLERYGLEGAIEAIEWSIENSYRSPFPPPAWTNNRPDPTGQPTFIMKDDEP